MHPLDGDSQLSSRMRLSALEGTRTRDHLTDHQTADTEPHWTTRSDTHGGQFELARHILGRPPLGMAFRRSGVRIPSGPPPHVVDAEFCQLLCGIRARFGGVTLSALTTILTTKYTLHRLCSIPQQRGQHMAVEVHGHAYSRVSENLHDYPSWNALREQQARRTVPQIMEPVPR